LTRKWIIGAIALTTAVLAVGAVGCSDDDDDDSTDASASATTGAVDSANEQLCNDLGDLETAVQGVQDLDSSSSVDDATSAVDAVQTAWDDAKSSAEAFEQAKATALATAVENLGDTIQNVSATDTLGDAQADVQASADEVKAARDDLSTDADCS
jgi:hypothetical protein